MSSHKITTGPLGLVLLSLGFASTRAEAAEASTTLTLPEAIELALTRNYALRRARLDERDAGEARRAANAGLLPRLDASAGYTRTVLAQNPFAGSSAGGLFSSGDAVGWLQFNEQQRLDGDDTTNPISLAAYRDRVQAGYDAAGVVTDDGRNPFLVENQFTAGLSLSQMLYDPAVFARREVAEAAEKVAAAGLNVESHRVVQSVSQAFYAALLQARRVEVAEQSVKRARENVEDTRGRVEAGVQPPFQLLTAEVELANLETTLTRARTDARNAVDQVRLSVGLARDLRLELKGELQVTDGLLAETPEQAAALETALRARPELVQLRSQVERTEADRSLAAAPYLPTLSLVGDLAVNGRVPDDRSTLSQNPEGDDPFAVQLGDRDFFDDDFWFTTLSFGLQLRWNLFEGFATQTAVDRATIQKDRATIAVEEAQLSIQIQVEQAVRELATARQQIAAQRRIRDRAELNYEQIQERVRAGSSSQFDLRQASEQLDDSRFNYLQAIHDFLVARVVYLVAIGEPPVLGAPGQAG